MLPRTVELGYGVRPPQTRKNDPVSFAPVEISQIAGSYARMSNHPTTPREHRRIILSAFPLVSRPQHYHDGTSGQSGPNSGGARDIRWLRTGR